MRFGQWGVEPNLRDHSGVREYTRSPLHPLLRRDRKRMTRILLATSNGVGMGHLTRQAAVAMSLPEGHEITIFSLSLGLPLTKDLGIPGEYCPSKDKPWIRGHDWNAYLRDRLISIVEETQAEVVVFDGVAPYRGIRMASDALTKVAFVWLRRGMWLSSVNESRLDPSKFFDLVIEPGDLAGKADRGVTAMRGDAQLVSPISMLESVKSLPRDEARRQLGLRPDGLVALLTLGSGRLGDVAGPGRVVAETLLAETDWQIAVTRSPIARNAVPVDATDRFVEIRNVYPLAKYLNAFDVAISSAGYNAVHEMIPAGLATLLVANSSTRRDDQHTRAHHLASIGLALAADDDDIEGVRSQLKELLDASLRSRLSKAGAETRDLMRGSAETGAVVLKLVQEFEEREVPLRRIIKAQYLDRLLAVGKWMANQIGPFAAGRTRVRLVDAPEQGSLEPLTLVLTHERSTELLQSETPVEHLLAGSSAAYRKRRLELIDSYYHVQPSKAER